MSADYRPHMDWGLFPDASITKELSENWPMPLPHQDSIYVLAERLEKMTAHAAKLEQENAIFKKSSNAA